MLCSAILHGLVALAILLGLPSFLSPPVPAGMVEALPVDLVTQGGPAAAAETGPPARPQSPSEDLLVDKPVIAPPPAERADSRKRVPHDATALPLRSRRARISRAMAPPPVPREGQSDAGPGITSGNGTSGSASTISVKDFLLAQVERHLEFSADGWGSADFVVSIHVLLEPDGTVRTADIVADPRYADDKLFHSIADSARRAVLVASPLQVPPGRYEAFRDVTLDINPRDIAQ